MNTKIPCKPILKKRKSETDSYKKLNSTRRIGNLTGESEDINDKI